MGWKMSWFRKKRIIAKVTTRRANPHEIALDRVLRARNSGQITTDKQAKELFSELFSKELGKQVTETLVQSKLGTFKGIIGGVFLGILGNFFVTSFFRAIDNPSELNLGLLFVVGFGLFMNGWLLVDLMKSTR